MEILASSEDASLTSKWLETCLRQNMKGSPLHEYYKTNNFTTIASMMSSHDEELLPQPAWIDFMNRPTIENAESMLHIYFGEEMEQIARMIESPTKLPSRCIQSQTTLQPCPTLVRGGTLTFSNVEHHYKFLGTVDVLHDLSLIKAFPYKHDLAIKLGVDDQISQTFHRHSKAFTRVLQETMTSLPDKAIISLKGIQYHGYSTTNTNPKIKEKKKKEIKTPSFMNDLFMNAALFKELSNVLKRRTATLMLDTFIYRKDKFIIQNGVLAAFLLFCLKRGFEAHKYMAWPFKSSQIENMVFLTGNMMKLDGAPLVHFIQCYIESVAKIIQAPVVLAVSKHSPIYFNRIFGNININERNIKYRPHHRANVAFPLYKVHLETMTDKRQPKEKGPVIPSASSIATWDEYKKHLKWAFPYHKSDLMHLVKETWKYKANHEYIEWLRSVCDLNFLRDAYRIDVVTQYPLALYITSDRLSYETFKAIKHHQPNVETTGILLHLKSFIAGLHISEANVHIA